MLPAMLQLHHHHQTSRPLFLQHLPANFSPNPSNLLLLIPSKPTSPLYPIKTTSTSSLPPPPPSHSRFVGGIRPRCSSEGGEEAAYAGDLLSGVVGEQVEALLRREENRDLLVGLEEASRRVEVARQALADIQRQEAETARAKDHVLQLETRQSEIAESQRELLAARAMVEEAERSLSLNMNQITSGDAPETRETEEINKDAERLESIKAASISSIIGTLAGFPISLTQATSSGQLLLHLAVIFISCALFGVTFRYTVRRDLDNIQLKTGTCAAFGSVRGLSAMEARKPSEFDSVSFISHTIDGAVYVSESIFIFIFSAIALDFCFKMRLISPFPIKK